MNQTTWQLTPRPDEKPGAENLNEVAIRNRFGPDAQIFSPPHSNDGERKFYFADLPDELQRVLLAQLRQPGDVSAVIEMPDGFQHYRAKNIAGESWTVAMLSLPKLNFERWLAGQNEGERSEANR